MADLEKNSMLASNFIKIDEKVTETFNMLKEALREQTI
jgi:hypothetical protein